MKHRLSVEQYKQKLIKQFGFASNILLKEYAESRQAEKLEMMKGKLDFNPFTDDPNCKTCKKKRH